MCHAAREDVLREGQVSVIVYPDEGITRTIPSLGPIYDIIWSETSMIEDRRWEEPSLQDALQIIYVDSFRVETREGHQKLMGEILAPGEAGRYEAGLAGQALILNK